MYSNESIAIGLLFFVAGVAFAALVAFQLLLFFVMRKVAASVAVLAELTQPLVKDKTLPKLVASLEQILPTFANMTKSLAVTSHDLRAFTSAVYGDKPGAEAHPQIQAEIERDPAMSSFEAMIRPRAATGAVLGRTDAGRTDVPANTDNSGFYGYNEEAAYVHEQDATLAQGGIVIDEALQTPKEEQINRGEV